MVETTDWSRALSSKGYQAHDDLVVMVRLAETLGRPLLLEGPAGSGKTALANAVAEVLDRPLVRLTCYEGLGAEEALYDWNYHGQLVALQQQRETEPFGPRFLLARPLLQAIQSEGSVLLIDEVDRADEAFEALLLEYLADYQITIPEMGTVKATTTPFTVLTSNRHRPLSDALRRRCLYAYVDWPERERELHIVALSVPGISPSIRATLTDAVRRLRTWDLLKPPGLAETLDWARAAEVTELTRWNVDWVWGTLGCVIKDAYDMESVRARVAELVTPDT